MKKQTIKKTKAEGALPPLYGDLSRWGLVQAESIKFLAKLPASCIDAVVTDPPYGIGFGGASWDGGVGNRQLSTGEGFERFSEAWARQVLRVLKPGGHLVSFGAARTGHRMTAGLEDAGFEIRDQLTWLFSSGMPKSRRLPGGRGSALKPAHEPIVLARKPLAVVGGTKQSIVSNDAQFGTGTLGVDATRIPRLPGDPAPEGYWPANVVLSHDLQCQGGACVSGCSVPLIDRMHSASQRLSRIFYASKATRAEREAGLEGLERRVRPVFSASPGVSRPRANIHATVKPLELMRWLVRLVAPAGGLVLDPFAGSGSTGCAVLLEGSGRQFIGLEREADYAAIARSRLAHWAKNTAPSCSEETSSEL